MQRASVAQRITENAQLGGPIHFGCWHGVGHFFHDAKGRSLGLYAKEVGVPWDHVDGRLTPGKRNHSGRLLSKGQQGEAALHHKDGWTALAVHDFTIDSRPGSNTVFFFHAELDEHHALLAVAEHFPDAARRIGEITLVA